jgi:DNA-binding IclR family transcriptional regulator
MDTDSTASQAQDNDKERAGIQSVEVGFALLEVLAQAPDPLMLRDLAAAAHKPQLRCAFSLHKFVMTVVNVVIARQRKRRQGRRQL